MTRPWPATPAFLRRLTQFNRRWSQRHRCLARWTGGGWWARGSVISPELRAWYNSFLPPADLQRDLRLLALDDLPSRLLLPSSLEPDAPPPLSVPDWWATLNDDFAGHLVLAPDAFPALLCNLADPARMGTDTGRYPEQTAALLNWLDHQTAARPLRLLDLGCGVGLGTYELAALLDDRNRPADVRGVTAEGLEVWMASHRQLPHDPSRQRRFPTLRPHTPVAVSFRRGHAEDYDDGTVHDLIVCNGLAGGRFLSAAPQLNAFLDTLERLLASNGLVLLGNRFHDGSRPGVERLMRLAVQRGWSLSGHWQSLQLRLPHSPPKAHSNSSGRMDG